MNCKGDSKTHLVIGLILLGAALRLLHYWENQPLWLDEAWVAVDILSKSFPEILVNRTYFPDLAFMPILFQVLCKLSVNAFGNHELTFRLFPFLSSLVSLVLFYHLLKKLGQGWVVFLALGLFALDAYLIYYAAELKPYASDVMVAIILALMFERLKRNYSAGAMYLFAGIAALGFWFSFPSIFVSGGFLISFIVFAWRNGQRERIGRAIFALVMIMIGSLGALTNLPQRLGANSPLGQMYRDYQIPIENGLWESARWIGDISLHVFKNPLGLLDEWLGLILFVLGFFAVFQRDKEKAVTFLSPILLTMLAAIWGKYLFWERLILFLAPFYFYFLAEGVVALAQRFTRGRLAVFGILVMLLFSRPVAEAIYYSEAGHQREDSRGAIQFLMHHYKKGDSLFLNNSAQYSFAYYLLKYGFYRQFATESLVHGKKVYRWRIMKGSDLLTEQNGEQVLLYQYESFEYSKVILSAAEENDYLAEGMDRSKLPSGRIWVLLIGGKPPARAFIKDRFTEQGETLLSFESFGAAAYLFELEEEPRPL